MDGFSTIPGGSINVEVTDPHADSDELKEEYGFGLIGEVGKDYDAVIVAVNHDSYKAHTPEYFKSLMKEQPIVMDLKGIYQPNDFLEAGLSYWRL